MASVFWLRHGGTMHPVHRGDCILGRSPACFIVLSSEKVSRQHAVVRYDRDQLTVTDLGSRNGTRVNGKRVKNKVGLGAGDVIQIGGHELEVVLREGRELPQTMDERDGDEASVRAQHRNILELAEELLTQATESEQRREISRTIRRLIDTLLDDTTRHGNQLTGGESVRLASVASVVAGWDGGDLDRWYDRVARALGATPTQEPPTTPDE